MKPDPMKMKTLLQCFANDAIRNSHGRIPWRGFTLVELLTVIAIIGILISITMPAVQQLRETARRSQCLSNLAQLAMAMHNYEFSQEHFPPGVINDQGPISLDETGKDVSFFVLLLPYLEQYGIAREFDVELGTYAPPNSLARRQVIALLRCPSANDGWELNLTGKAGTSSYAGCHHGVEAPIDADNHGCLFLNSAIRLNQILDGSSNTLLLSEKFVDQGDLGWASGTRASLRNTSRLLNSSDWMQSNFGSNDPPNLVGGFGSNHLGAVNSCLADGSIHTLSVTISPTVFQNLGDRADGAMMGNWR
jgi:prepilin-type N-terminal cleavage/methylation domain-containing protein